MRGGVSEPVLVSVKSEALQGEMVAVAALLAEKASGVGLGAEDRNAPSVQRSDGEANGDGTGTELDGWVKGTKRESGVV